MRATDLLPPLLNERHSPRRARRRRASVEPPAPETLTPAPATQAVIAHPTPTPTPAADPAVERVRSAGGPIDNACYSCACGLVFAAAVSTTVCCPRCGADQAW